MCVLVSACACLCLSMCACACLFLYVRTRVCACVQQHHVWFALVSVIAQLVLSQVYNDVTLRGNCMYCEATTLFLPRALCHRCGYDNNMILAAFSHAYVCMFVSVYACPFVVGLLILQCFLLHFLLLVIPSTGILARRPGAAAIVSHWRFMLKYHTLLAACDC
jgi:hypothetical protein